MVHNLEVFLQAGFLILDLFRHSRYPPTGPQCHKNEETLLKSKCIKIGIQSLLIMIMLCYFLMEFSITGTVRTL